MVVKNELFNDIGELVTRSPDIPWSFTRTLYKKQGKPQQETEEQDEDDEEGEDSDEASPQIDEIIESLTWTYCETEEQKKQIPQKTERKTTDWSTISIVKEPIGPILFGPWDSVSTILMFWHTARRLIHD
jgi:hypothetical protein